MEIREHVKEKETSRSSHRALFKTLNEKLRTAMTWIFQLVLGKGWAVKYGTIFWSSQSSVHMVLILVGVVKYGTIKESLHVAFFSPLFKNAALLFSIVSMKNAQNGSKTHSVHFS